MAAEILIIDNSCQLAELIRDLLGQIGYAAIICETAQQALAMVELYRPHLILVNKTVADELNASRLLEYIQQIDSGAVWVSGPLHAQPTIETQYPMTALDNYLSELRVYRVRRSADNYHH